MKCSSWEHNYHYPPLFLPDLRTRSYQSVAISGVSLPPCGLEGPKVSCLFHSTCALEVTKVSLLSRAPTVLRPLSYQSVTMYRLFHPTCDLEVSEVSLLSCSPPVLRPRSYQSAIIYHFGMRPRRYQSVATFAFPSNLSRLAPSKLPQCHSYYYFY